MATICSKCQFSKWNDLDGWKCKGNGKINYIDGSVVWDACYVLNKDGNCKLYNRKITWLDTIKEMIRLSREGKIENT